MAGGIRLVLGLGVKVRVRARFRVRVGGLRFESMLEG